MGQWRIRLGHFVEGDVLMYRPWSVITHMFVHVDIWHMVINMAWLYWMGRMFMVQFGARRLLSTYMVGGLAGFVLYAVASNLAPAFQQSTFAYGASAATMAIMAATATANPNTNMRLFLLGAVPLKYLAICWVLLIISPSATGPMPAATSRTWAGQLWLPHDQAIPSRSGLGGVV